MTDLLDPKLDVVFKMQFAEKVDLLIDLINAVRSDAPPVMALEIRNPQITAEELEGKHIVLDILAQDAIGAYYNVEMQTNRHAGWQARSVYYLARALSAQLDAGEGYARLQPVVGVHLLDFDLFPTEPDVALWTFEMRARQRHRVLLDDSMELNVIELPKADRLYPHTSSVLAQWVAYFKHWHEESVMQQIQHPPVQKAYQHLRALSGDELARHQAFVRERAMRDAMSEREEAIAIGEARGEAKGRVAERRDVLRQLLQIRFGEFPSSVEERLQAAEFSQLAYWLNRVLTAQTLEQVFSDH